MDFRQMLAQSAAGQGQLTGLQPPPQYGAQLPNRSVPLWFGGKPQVSQGTAPWVSPQQNSYWPQILALLQNPLLLPQAPGVQPIPQLPIPGMPQLPPVFPGGGALPPGSIPPATAGTGGAGTVLPPTGTLPGSVPPAAPPPVPAQPPRTTVPVGLGGVPLVKGAVPTTPKRNPATGFLGTGGGGRNA